MTACALILAATLSATPVDTTPSAATTQDPVVSLAAAIAATPPPDTAPEPWMLDRKVNRPGAVKTLYGTLAALHALDIYSTRRALNRGSSEINPIVEKAAGNAGAMIAVKAVSSAASVYFAERAWKKNRKGAVVLMAALNGVTAAVVARNLRNAR